jgi:hypothetical protein
MSPFTGYRYLIRATKEVLGLGKQIHVAFASNTTKIIAITLSITKALKYLMLSK